MKIIDSKYIHPTFILNFLININILISDILLCYFAIIGASIFNYEKTNYIFSLGIYLWILQLLIEFILWIFQSHKNYSNTKFSNILLVILGLYGMWENFNSNNFLLLNLLIINLGIRSIIHLMLQNDQFLSNKKRILLHELGHFFVSKEYKILDPQLIDMNKVGDSFGRLISIGNVEDTNPFEYVTMLLSGYIAENYILHDKKEYGLREVRNILLIELESNQYSNSYLSRLIKIYLDDNKLQESIANILKIIDKYKNDMVSITKKNRYKMTIDLKELKDNYMR